MGRIGTMEDLTKPELALVTQALVEWEIRHEGMTSVWEEHLAEVRRKLQG